MLFAKLDREQWRLAEVHLLSGYPRQTFGLHRIVQPFLDSFFLGLARLYIILPDARKLKPWDLPTSVIFLAAESVQRVYTDISEEYLCLGGRYGHSRIHK